MSRETKPIAPPADDDLVRLLAAEQRLEQLVTDARSEASRIVTTAATAAAEAERALEAELARALAELSTRLQGEAAEQQSGIRAEADATAKRLDGMRADQVDAIARQLIERMVTS